MRALGIHFNKTTKRYYIDTTISLSNKKIFHFKYHPKDEKFKTLKYVRDNYASIVNNKKDELEAIIQAKKNKDSTVIIAYKSVNTFDELIDSYFMYRSKEIKNATVQNYKMIIKNDIKPYTKETIGSYLNRNAIISIRCAALAKDTANLQKQRILYINEELIKFARKLKIIDSDTKDDLLDLLEIKFGVATMKESKNQFTSIQEAEKVFEVAESEYWKDIFILLYYSTLRIGEFLGIKVSDITFKKDSNGEEYAEIKIQRQRGKDSEIQDWLKNGMPYKYVYYYTERSTILKKYIEMFKLNEDDFLIDETRTTIRRYLNKAFKKAGVKHNTLHGFARKSINTELYLAGADSKTRATLLGQKSVKVNDENYVQTEEALKKVKNYLKYIK